MVRSGLVWRLMPVVFGLWFAWSGQAAASLEEEPAAEAPATIWDALTQGKVSVNLRLRMEIANQEGVITNRFLRDRSNAYTSRLRVGYATQEFLGLSGYLEFEDIRNLNGDLYNDGTNGPGRRTVVPDPADTEVNQAYLHYNGEDVKTRAWLGRQRIAYDDHRFIGNVGWRQNEQTFDAVHFENHALENVRLNYAYLSDINRIFGPDANMDFDSDSHLFHAELKLPEDAGTLVGFAYLLRFSNANMASSDTVGVRYKGGLPLGEEWRVDATGSYAHQIEGRSNRTNYATSYYQVQGSLGWVGKGNVGAAWEELGSDSGVGFSTPLSTLHAHNGWADAFLATPATGLQDFSLFAGADLPAGIKGKVIYHRFKEERGGTRFGQELDALLTKKINDNWSVLAKAAVFNGQNGFVDRVKYWLETTFQF